MRSLGRVATDILTLLSWLMIYLGCGAKDDLSRQCAYLHQTRLNLKADPAPAQRCTQSSLSRFDDLVI